ncbi:MAG TPA: purine-nucleoside phosphorylase [Bacteroidota bacterium]|nr:purine-nucleoside phosphorylase [Bacteroidota bacterium]
MNTNLQESVSYIRTRTTAVPKIALVLGSGLGDFGDHLTGTIALSANEIPHYPTSSVQGHAGRLLFGMLENGGRRSAQLVVFQGRVHFYECADLHKVVYPIHVAQALGAELLLVTNAAGGINRLFTPGDLMFIRDYINFTGENPLVGEPDVLLRRNVPSFDPGLLAMAKRVAETNRIQTREGVYCWTKGPTYETAAEIRMMTAAGADAVGMSTAPEVMVAAQCGMKTLGISCITNMATGISKEKLSHVEVTETANMVKKNFTKLLTEILFELSA